MSQNNSIFDCDKDIILEFKLNIISSKLTKTTHYTSYQQKIYLYQKNMKKLIYSVFTLGFIVSCSSGVGGDESIELNNSIEELIINKQWWFESSDNTYGLFFGDNDSLFHIDEYCNSSFDGIYSINSDSTIDIMNYENGLQIIESWEIYYVTNEELSITINNNNSTIINQIFNTNFIPDLCSQEISDYLTQNIFYSDINNLENESCFRKKIIFNNDGSGIGGDICDYNLWSDSIVNFNWSLSGTILEITFLNQSIHNERQVLSIDNGLTFDQSLYVEGGESYHNHEFWYTTTPEFESQDWMTYDFKLTGQYIHESNSMDGYWSDTLVTVESTNIYSFCEYDPYVMYSNIPMGQVYTWSLYCNQFLDGIDEFDNVIVSSISFDDNTLNIRHNWYNPDGDYDITYIYSVIEN